MNTLGNTKVQVRRTVARKTAAFIAAGGEVTVLRERASCGMTSDDWRNAVCGERFVSNAEAEEHRTELLRSALKTGKTVEQVAAIIALTIPQLKRRLVAN